jgi:DNA-binding XRE family transcriptional regulator
MTYLETYRLRTGFSRAELAFLLGAMDGKTVTRHERGTRLPKLRTALGYGLILEASIDQLYEGLVIEVHGDVRARARGLCRHIRKLPRNKKNERKIEILRRLAGDEENPLAV